MAGTPVRGCRSSLKRQSDRRPIALSSTSDPLYHRGIHCVLFRSLRTDLSSGGSAQSMEEPRCSLHLIPQQRCVSVVSKHAMQSLAVTQEGTKTMREDLDEILNSLHELMLEAGFHFEGRQ